MGLNIHDFIVIKAKSVKKMRGYFIFSFYFKFNFFHIKKYSVL